MVKRLKSLSLFQFFLIKKGTLFQVLKDATLIYIILNYALLLY